MAKYVAILFIFVMGFESMAQDASSITFYKTEVIVHPDKIPKVAPTEDFMASKPKTGREEWVYLAHQPTQLNKLTSKTFEATKSTTSFHPDVKKNKDFERVPINVVQEIDISDNEKIYLDYNGMAYLVFVNRGETKEDKVQMATALTFEKESFDYIFLSNDMQLFGVKPNKEVMQFDSSYLLSAYNKIAYYLPHVTKFQKYIAGGSTLIGAFTFAYTKNIDYMSDSTFFFSALNAVIAYVAMNISAALTGLSRVSEVSNTKSSYLFFANTGLTLEDEIRELEVSNRDPHKNTFYDISYELQLKNGESFDLAKLLKPYGHFNNKFKKLFNNKDALTFLKAPTACLKALK